MLFGAILAVECQRSWAVGERKGRLAYNLTIRNVSCSDGGGDWEAENIMANREKPDLPPRHAGDDALNQGIIIFEFK